MISSPISLQQSQKNSTNNDSDRYFKDTLSNCQDSLLANNYNEAARYWIQISGSNASSTVVDLDMDEEVNIKLVEFAVSILMNLDHDNENTQQILNRLENMISNLPSIPSHVLYKSRITLYIHQNRNDSVILNEFVRYLSSLDTEKNYQVKGFLGDVNAFCHSKPTLISDIITILFKQLANQAYSLSLSSNLTICILVLVKISNVQDFKTFANLLDTLGSFKFDKNHALLISAAFWNLGEEAYHNDINCAPEWYLLCSKPCFGHISETTGNQSLCRACFTYLALNKFDQFKNCIQNISVSHSGVQCMKIICALLDGSEYKAVSLFAEMNNQFEPCLLHLLFHIACQVKGNILILKVLNHIQSRLTHMDDDITIKELIQPVLNTIEDFETNWVLETEPTFEILIQQCDILYNLASKLYQMNELYYDLVTKYLLYSIYYRVYFQRKHSGPEYETKKKLYLVEAHSKILQTKNDQSFTDFEPILNFYEYEIYSSLGDWSKAIESAQTLCLDININDQLVQAVADFAISFNFSENDQCKILNLVKTRHENSLKI